MVKYSYKTIVDKAKKIKENAEKNQKKPSQSWIYYIAKAILKPKTDIVKINIDTAKNSTGNDFSRQIKKSDYTDMAKRLVKYVETEEQMPNYISIGSKKMRVSDYAYMFSNVLVYYDKNGKFPSEVDVNSKVYVKPTETKGTIFNLWVNTFKFTPKYLDDVCDYILKHFTYQFYYDDKKSNSECILTKSGNCTDLLQLLCVMAQSLGYEWKAIHVRCNRSGVGHVYGMFRKSSVNGGNWFIRDIACIADESRYCIWCEANNGGTKLAENPAWFKENLYR